jgi:sulfoxide reductase heme-binding subunit YedZ
MPGYFRWIWWLILLLSLAPAMHLVAMTLGWWGSLGTNPIETWLVETGRQTIIALLIALAVTPLRRLTRQPWVTRLRRMLGLVAFFYASLHFMVWLGVDLFFAWDLIIEDLTTRPFVMVGFAAWLILLALALTSTRRAMTKLGRNWTRLHRLVYAAGILGILHIFWLTRADYRDVSWYAGILALLLGFRVGWWWFNRAKAHARQSPPRVAG